MLRTGEQYRASLRDGRQVWINGERAGPLAFVKRAAGLSDTVM